MVVTLQLERGALPWVPVVPLAPLFQCPNCGARGRFVRRNEGSSARCQTPVRARLRDRCNWRPQIDAVLDVVAAQFRRHPAHGATVVGRNASAVQKWRVVKWPG